MLKIRVKKRRSLNKKEKDMNVTRRELSLDYCV